MLYEEYLALIDSGESAGLDPSLVISEFRQQCAVDDFVALQLSAVSNKYERGAEIEVHLGTGKGTTFLLTCAREPFEFSAASSLWAAAFLHEIAFTEVKNTLISWDYRFEHDYIVTHRLTYEQYVKRYKLGSSVWGAFVHIEELGTIATPLLHHGAIQAFPEIRLPTKEHEDAASRAVQQASASGRYLNLYHLLELSFDYDLIEDIRRLPNDLRGVGKLLSTYNHTELVRLTRLIQKYWTSSSEIARSLAQVFSSTAHRGKLESLLFDYAKEGNPYPDKRVELFAAGTTSFTEAEFKKLKLEWNLEKLQKLTAYVIYRFRCAIAHATIGEYIVGSDDEPFVAELGEPLVKMLLSRMYRS